MRVPDEMFLPRHDVHRLVYYLTYVLRIIIPLSRCRVSLPKIHEVQWTRSISRALPAFRTCIELCALGRSKTISFQDRMTQSLLLDRQVSLLEGLSHCVGNHHGQHYRPFKDSSTCNLHIFLGCVHEQETNKYDSQTRKPEDFWQRRIMSCETLFPI
jgi:hypothetical protein